VQPRCVVVVAMLTVALLLAAAVPCAAREIRGVAPDDVAGYAGNSLNCGATLPT
jgi:hypothetical protein